MEKATERSHRARDRERIIKEKKSHEKKAKKSSRLEGPPRKIELSKPGHQSCHYDEKNEEALNEKGVQTEEVMCTEVATQSEEYDYSFIPLKQDEKHFD